MQGLGRQAKNFCELVYRDDWISELGNRSANKREIVGQRGNCICNFL